MSPDSSKPAMESKPKDAKGKVKEKLGWAAGDREVEAKGRVEREQAAAEEGRMDTEAVESVEGAEEEVRRTHEEID